MQNFLFNKLDIYSEDWILDNYKNIPLYISTNKLPKRSFCKVFLLF